MKSLMDIIAQLSQEHSVNAREQIYRRQLQVVVSADWRLRDGAMASAMRDVACVISTSRSGGALRDDSNTGIGFTFRENRTPHTPPRTFRDSSRDACDTPILAVSHNARSHGFSLSV